MWRKDVYNRKNPQQFFNNIYITNRHPLSNEERTKAVIAATASLASKQCRESHYAFVLLTAPKIFAIGLVTDKNSCRNFARLSAWWFDWAGHPHPKRKSIQSVLINGMCNFEDGTRAATAASKSSVGLTSHTSPFCNDYNKLQLFAFWFLCSFFPHAKNCAFIFLTHTQVRLFLTCGSPCV